MITAVMISRLVLNLRHSDSAPFEHYSGSSGFNFVQKTIVDQSFMTRTIIGNLGEDLIISGSSTEDAKEENLDLPLVNISTLSRAI